MDDPIGDKMEVNEIKNKTRQNEIKNAVQIDKSFIESVAESANLPFIREFVFPESNLTFKLSDFPSFLKSRLQLGPAEDFAVELHDTYLILKASCEDVLELAGRECQVVAETGKFRSLKKSEKITEKILLTFTPLPVHISFVRGKLLGPQGSFLKHIQSSTRTCVQLRGNGSGYFEVKGPVAEGSTLEQMCLVVEGTDTRSVKEAKQLCEDLIATVKSEYDAKIVPPINQAQYQAQYQQQYNVQYQAYMQQQYNAQYQAYMQQQAAAYAQYYAHYLKQEDPKDLDNKD